MMRRFVSHSRRHFSTAATSPENILASVLFERLPLVVPKIDPVVYAFQELFVAYAVHSVLGDLSSTYLVGNAPMGHMTIQKREDVPDSPSFKLIAEEEFDMGKCKDFVWVTKEELLEYFPDQAEFLDKMIIS